MSIWSDGSYYRICIDCQPSASHRVCSLLDLCKMIIQQRPLLFIPELLPKSVQESLGSTSLPLYKFSWLEDGDTLVLARRLKDFLTEMFGNHQLLITSNICVYFAVVSDEMSDPKVKVPSTWKQEVNNHWIHMANIGINKGSFVIWGPLFRFGETGIYRPYILLAGLTRSVSIKTLLEKNLLGKILRFLKMWVVNRTFHGLEGLKKKIELACPIPPANHRDLSYNDILVWDGGPTIFGSAARRRESILFT